MSAYRRINTVFYKNDKLETTLFDWEGNKLPNETEISPRSRVKFVAALFSLSRGTFGLTLKPKLMQIRLKPEENHFDTCLLKDSDEDGETDGGECQSLLY